MKRTTEVSELTGFNESPIAGTFIISSNRDFTNRHVTPGVSILYNKTRGGSEVVDSVTASRINTISLYFAPGDLFLVTLSTDWTIQNSDGPIIDVECRRCGWSYPRKELINGLCKVCVDKPKPV